MNDASPRLTEIRRAGRSRRRATLYLDGEAWRTTTTSVARDLALSVGDAVDPASVDADARELERPEARERALRLLGYRERSVTELRTRLEDDGYPSDIVIETVGDLARVGLVDDERFAGLLAHSLVDVRGYGRMRARQELVRHGIAPDAADAALETVAPAGGEADRAVASALRMVRPTDTIDRLAARLVRRGFSAGVAFAAARHAVPEAPDTGEIDA